MGQCWGVHPSKIPIPARPQHFDRDTNPSEIPSPARSQRDPRFTIFNCAINLTNPSVDSVVGFGPADRWEAFVSSCGAVASSGGAAALPDGGGRGGGGSIDWQLRRGQWETNLSIFDVLDMFGSCRAF